jgi:hypothetical protein
VLACEHEYIKITVGNFKLNWGIVWRERISIEFMMEKIYHGNLSVITHNERWHFVNRKGKRDLPFTICEFVVSTNAEKLGKRGKKTLQSLIDLHYIIPPSKSILCVCVCVIISNRKVHSHFMLIDLHALHVNSSIDRSIYVSMRCKINITKKSQSNYFSVFSFNGWFIRINITAL